MLVNYIVRPRLLGNFKINLGKISPNPNNISVHWCNTNLFKVFSSSVQCYPSMTLRTGTKPTHSPIMFNILVFSRSVVSIEAQNITAYITDSLFCVMFKLPGVITRSTAFSSTSLQQKQGKQWLQKTNLIFFCSKKT